MKEELSTLQKYLRLFLPLVLLIAVIFAGMSLFQHTKLVYGIQSGPSFCNINAALNCDAVNSSAWATFLGLPLAAYGVAFYISLLLWCFAARDGALVPPNVFADVSLFFGALASVVSIVLFGISELLIGSLCLLCIGMYVSNFAIFTIAIGLSTSSGSIVRRFFAGLRHVLHYPTLLLGAASGLPQGALSVARAISAGGLALIVASFFLSRFFYAAFMSDTKNQQTYEELFKIAYQDWDTQIKLDIAFDDGNSLTRDYARGPEGAPVEIVEFGDFECPACRMFYRELEEMLAHYPGKIRYIYRHYPLDQRCNKKLPRQMHERACYLSYVSRCAGEQGKFWQVTDYIYSMPGLDNPSAGFDMQSELQKAVTLFDLDGQALNSCVVADRTIAKIESDLAAGELLGVTGTPSVWLNGKRVRAAQPIIIRHLIDRILAQP